MRPLDRAIGCKNVPVQCFLRRGARLGPATWARARGKPDILLILLNKLLEDGNVLYKKEKLKEASHRYSYGLKKKKKFPDASEEVQSGQDKEKDNLVLHLETFTQLKLNLLLNLSRCKRKMNECEEAIELANQALKMRQTSYEVLYARAKASINLGHLDAGLADVQEALQLAPINSGQDRRVLRALKNEIVSKIDETGISYGKTITSTLTQL